MTNTEFLQFTKLYASYWRSDFDSYGIKAWEKVLGALDCRRLCETLTELTKTEQFPPTIKIIIDKYEEMKRAAAAAKRQRDIEQYEKTLKLTTDEQYKCLICDNTGDVIFQRKGYNTYCRCSCARGKDLNKWSQYQITKNMMWRNPQTNKDENLYIADIEDVLPREEIELIKIKNSKEYQHPQKFNIQETIDNLSNKMAMEV